MKNASVKIANDPLVVACNRLSDCQDVIRSFISRSDEVFILVDANTSKYCYPLLSEVLHDLPEENLISIEGGEAEKSLLTCEKIYNQLIEKNAGRNSLLINLGGGVVTDLGGFIASTFKRGIDFIHIPTSLIAMADAAIGGKTAINIHGIKNQVGTISLAVAVFIFPEFLKSLPNKENLSGLSEIIKYTLISDIKYWNTLNKTDFDEISEDWSEHIIRSVRLKLEIIKDDLHDQNDRRKLNFGHTIGHAIECLKNTHESVCVTHGEAVAAGMICAAYISFKRKMLERKELDEIVKYITSLFTKIVIDNNEVDMLLELTRHDKKSISKEHRFVLLHGIGNAVYDQYVSDKEINDALNFYIRL